MMARSACCRTDPAYHSALSGSFQPFPGWSSHSDHSSDLSDDDFADLLKNGIYLFFFVGGEPALSYQFQIVHTVF